MRDLEKVSTLLADEIISKGGKVGKFDDSLYRVNKENWDKAHLPHHDTLSDIFTSIVNGVAQLAHRYLRLGSPDATNTLINTNNLMYAGTVYIGSNKQPLDVIFDTGSDWLVVEDTSCTTCVSTIFNKTKSTTFEVNSTTTRVLNYGSASFQGHTGNDTVGLDSSQNTAAPDFMFYLITKQTGISSNIDGIMGMARNY